MKQNRDIQSHLTKDSHSTKSTSISGATTNMSRRTTTTGTTTTISKSN